MLKTFLGPIENEENTVYFRPETAQAMFVDFKNILETSRKKIPFGIAQIGKAFRNEITPGNFIFRTREFEQMEIEYFIKEEEWEKLFEHWRKEMWSWITDTLGLDKKNIHELDVPKDELAHYSKKTIDFEYDFPFGKDELYGLAYRTDFDLKNHYKEQPYNDLEAGEKFYPHVVEPTWGVDRSVLAVLCDAYTEEKDRVVLKVKPALAPYKVAVFPLLKNKPELIEKAKEVYKMLKKEFNVAWDDRGNIGKRYYSQDEIGTPFCVTVDFDSLEKDDVTIRDRDTMKQERVKIKDLVSIINGKLA
jgi:glycyl-tRNA synthetase